MKTLEQRKNVLTLHEQGYNKSEISRFTGISRFTVRDIISGGVAKLAKATDLGSVEGFPSCEFESHHRYHYSYILSMYLGDGCISKHERAYRLRITLDTKYPNIIQEAKKSLEFVFPKNKIGITRRKNANCVDVSCYSKHMVSYFPQHGKGSKHKREIRLKLWQLNIVKEFPWQFLKGFIHSDGCRYTTMDRGLKVHRYAFKNFSEDIRNLFMKTADKLKIQYAYADGDQIVFVNKKDSVALMDEYIGFKK